ncbi:MAG TPA: portal protein [Clostridiales bacterium]|nr:portal protein [Clostridiales bacterium]
MAGDKNSKENLQESVINASQQGSLEDLILTSALRGEYYDDLFNSFSSTAQTREAMYELIDTMTMDSTIAAVVETYAEDISQPNMDGKVFWVECDDEDILEHVNYLLSRLDVDRYAFLWAYNLVKYGDVYVRLLRNSDFESSRLFNSIKVSKNNVLDNEDEEKDKLLTEAVNVMITREGDNYALSLDTVRNPNEMFELTKFGRSLGYIQTTPNVQRNFSNNNDPSFYTRYKMKKDEVNIYSATEFVHGCLDAANTRTMEEVDIYFNDEDYDSENNYETFQVRRGTGILHNLFKVWRQLSLLENSVLLNRVTRSSVIRAIQMEIGDMPPNQVRTVTSRLKNLIENKTALDVGNNMSEYTNPGPMLNLVVIPTRNGKGTISIDQIGGEIDPKQLTDLDWFNNKLFGGLRAQKQFFGWTDDAAGFDAGSSLAQQNSRYGKSIKRYQGILRQMVTDIIHLILIEQGYLRYINKFTIMMATPITKEEIDRKAELSDALGNLSSIMSSLTDLEKRSSRLKVLKSLIADIVPNIELQKVIADEISEAETKERLAREEPEGSKEDFDFESDFSPSSMRSRPSESVEDSFSFEEFPQLPGMEASDLGAPEAFEAEQEINLPPIPDME